MDALKLTCSMCSIFEPLASLSVGCVLFSVVADRFLFFTSRSSLASVLETFGSLKNGDFRSRKSKIVARKSFGRRSCSWNIRSRSSSKRN